jgi:hypothetical protein
MIARYRSLSEDVGRTSSQINDIRFLQIQSIYRDRCHLEQRHRTIGENREHEVGAASSKATAFVAFVKMVDQADRGILILKSSARTIQNVVKKCTSMAAEGKSLDALSLAR